MTLLTIQQMTTNDLIGESPCIQRLREEVSRLADYDVNLLLQGESGTGKELIARIVHGLSCRRECPLACRFFERRKSCLREY